MSLNETVIYSYLKIVELPSNLTLPMQYRKSSPPLSKLEVFSDGEMEYVLSQHH